MIAFLLWYFFLSLAGLLAFPLAYRFLPALADRGYAFSRALGLLLWGFFFWLLASYQIISNTSGGIFLALVVLALISAGSMRGGRWRQALAWLREQRKTVLVVEILFFLAFAGWAVVRATNPDITGTEKPMELAFINAILHSPSFPPHDPWLSGYAISYYYFGYVLVAMVAKITATPGGVAFNLAVSMVSGLTAINAYGLLYSLLRQRFHRVAKFAARGWALLAPVCILLVGNFEGFLEMLHARGLFWNADGTSSFWKWIDLQELISPPAQPLTWIPNRPGGIWWWRASRVVSDYNMAGTYKEVIDEFPLFSFLLSDLHPHVLAMPFALLAIGLALNFFLASQASPLPGMGVIPWMRLWWRGEATGFGQTRLGAWMRHGNFWLVAVVLGGLAFLNTWDFPIYVGLLSAAYVLARVSDEGWGWPRIYELLELAAALILAGALLYLPFYLGFQSQAGGPLPSLSFYTRGIHLWIMFGTLLLPVAAWLGYLWYWRGNRAAIGRGLKFGAALVFGLWLASYLLSWLVLTLLAGSDRFAALRNLFYDLHGAPTALILLGGSIARRLAQPGAWLTLLGLIAVVWGMLSTYSVRRETSAPTPPPPAGEESGRDGVSLANRFLLLLILLAAGLVLAPEFFYLRDQFGGRMNTIFKFYYQSWILLAIAAAYATTVLWTALRGAVGMSYRVLSILVLALALVYPIFGLWERTNGFAPDRWSLDGTSYMSLYQPEEYAGIQWLQYASPGVVAEAVGGSYTTFARVSAISGQPTVLGWPGHESQWRGGATEMGSRQDDIARLYQTARWEEAAQILQQYRIRYIFIGSLERGSYRVNEAKFQANLSPVYSNNSVVIYETPDTLWNTAPVTP